jgi:DNA-binding CsgD family transcriptional regulator/tetratricopeptide (TPR) repeat protein
VIETVGPRLLERAASLASLATFANEARRGDGRLVLISGEAGVGKSALVERFRQDLPEARWSWGICDGLCPPRPLGPLIDVADQLGGALLESCDAGADRDALFRALLRQISTPETLDVVAVEDVHWADEATLDLLRFMGRRLRDASVLMIATYRDDAVAGNDPLSVTLGDLARQRSTRRISLTPLSLDATGMLADGSGWEAPELFRLTGGNPFFLSEVLQAGMRTVPVSARDATLARAAGLSGEARGVLDVAALIGARMELTLLASVTECSGSVMDELLACGLLVRDEGWLRFRHEIARLALDQAIAPYRAGDIHGRILDALVSSGCADDARLAFHAEAAADGAAVLRYASAAAWRAAGLASHREAVAQFERALRFVADADTSSVAALYDGLADEMALVDRWQEAAEACERALALWREVGDRLREGDTLRRLSLVIWSLFRADEAITTIEAAMAVLESLRPSVELARAYATCATLQMLSLGSDTAAGLAERAQEIAERLGTRDVLSDALNTRAVCAAFRGGAWTALMSRALEIALSENLYEQAGRAYNNFCALHVSQWQFADAERYFTEGVAHCDEYDLTCYATSLRNDWAAVLERTGRWDDALALSTELLARADSSPANQVCTLIRLGSINARRGEPNTWEYLAEANEAADPLRTVPIRLARAEMYWLEGKPNEALHEAERAHALATNCDAWIRGSVAVWLARTGSDLSPAGDIAEPYRLELDGDWTGAARLWAEMNAPYDAAMALTRAEDEEELNQAFNTFKSLGAFPAARIVREKLRLIGARSLPTGPQATTRAHPFGLTKREHEVLALICAAHTNTDIAKKLFISPKTVEYHVTAILAKMGAPNRIAAARQAIRHGLTGK